MLKGLAVQEAIYDFAQRCFIGGGTQTPADFSGQDGLFERLGQGPLNVQDVHRLPSAQRRLLHELLTQYIMFLQFNPGLPFPPDFLGGTSKEQLGSSLLDYMREHRWPFPQLLKKKH